MSRHRASELKVLAVALGLVLAVLLASTWRSCLSSPTCNHFDKPPGQEIVRNAPHLAG